MHALTDPIELLRAAVTTPPLRVALIAMMSFTMTACAHGRTAGSYLPVGASSQFGDRTMDGAVLILAHSRERVHAAVTRAFASDGYVLDDEDVDKGRLQTTPRALGGDTTLVVLAELTVPDPSSGTVVVFTGRYSVPSSRIQRAQVIQRPGQKSALYARLSALADSTRRFARATP